VKEPIPRGAIPEGRPISSTQGSPSGSSSSSRITVTSTIGPFSAMRMRSRITPSIAPISTVPSR
jgi:hypothetical protein